MNCVVKVIMLFMLVHQGSSEMCFKNASMYDIPNEMLASGIITFTVSRVARFMRCPDSSIDQNKIGLWLYNKEHHQTPLRLDLQNSSGMDPKRKTIFIIHGWTCNFHGDGLPEMRDAFLKRYPNANVIAIDWATYAVDRYTTSFCRIPKIAELLGQFMCNLNTQFGVDLNDLHIVGHSMGAHMSGFIGQETQQQCTKKIGRITGLDPAGPMYHYLPESKRLDASDANIVDVIHTNQGVFGYQGACGTVDFYPNCGYAQPGCQQLSLTTNVTELVNLPYKIWTCSHVRSIYLFTESILADKFQAKSCTLCPGAFFARVCVADFFYGTTATMGEGYINNPKSSSAYYLKTNSRSPYFTV